LSKDKTVLLWETASMLQKPINKITHNDHVIGVSYNPQYSSIISYTRSQFIIYKEEDKNSNKIKLQNNVVCFNWSPDGNLLAFGQENGVVMIKERDKEKEVKICIIFSNDNNERVSCVNFSSKKFKNKNYILMVGTWMKKLYFIDVIYS
jgi:WD40 repeat protein